MGDAYVVDEDAEVEMVYFFMNFVVELEWVFGEVGCDGEDVEVRLFLPKLFA